MNTKLLANLETRRPNLSLKVRFLPLIFIELYLIATVFLFRDGPWPWPVRDGFKLYSYLTLTHLAFIFGYLSSVLKKPGNYYGQVSFKRLIYIGLVLNFLLLLPTSFQRTGSFLPDIRAGIQNPGSAYAHSLSWRSESSAIVEYIRIFFAPVLFMVLPLATFYWSKLSRWIKYFVILYVGFYIAIFISMGTNKAIADLIIVVPIIVLAARYAGMFRLRLKNKFFIFICLSTVIVLFMTFFTAGQVTRPGSGAMMGYFPSAHIFAKQDHPLVTHLSPVVRAGVFALSSYLTQGYYGLSLALDKPFVPMFGVGNSMFLYLNVSEILGNESITQMPYPVRTETDGWNAYINWSSIYPWLASDVSFLGTIPVIFLIGRLFSMSWVDSIFGKNPFAIAAFAQFSIMLFYFPANNQCLQSGETFMSFWVIMGLWLFTRKKYVWRVGAEQGLTT